PDQNWMGARRGSGFRGFGVMGNGPSFHRLMPIDTNNDQKISKEELLKQFDKVDADKDGQVTRAEIIKVVAARTDRAPTQKIKDPKKRDGNAIRRRAPGFEKKKPDAKPEEKKPATEAPKTEEPAEAKPAEAKPADAKTSEGSTKRAEPVAAAKPVAATATAPVEAVRPEPRGVSSESSMNDAPEGAQPPVSPSA
ncbi:MAG: hypothetical protein AB7O26_17580, partial [Planctomycetaceae bacterium]